MKSSIYNILLLIAVSLAQNAHAAGRSQIKASLDSLQLTMGQQTIARVDIVKGADAPSELLVDKNAFPAQVEIIDWLEGDTTDIGNGLVEIKRGLLIQSFDSGVYTIPPFLLVSGPDTIRSNSLSLKVNPVDVTALTDIHPIADVAEFDSKWYDWLPDWITDYWVYILLGLLIIAGGVCAYLIMSKRLM